MTHKHEISSGDAWKAYPDAMQALVDGAWMGTREMTFYAAGKALYVEFHDDGTGSNVIKGSLSARTRKWTWRQSSL